MLYCEFKASTSSYMNLLYFQKYIKQKKKFDTLNKLGEVHETMDGDFPYVVMHTKIHFESQFSRLGVERRRDSPHYCKVCKSFQSQHEKEKRPIMFHFLMVTKTLFTESIYLFNQLS